MMVKLHCRYPITDEFYDEWVDSSHVKRITHEPPTYTQAPNPILTGHACLLVLRSGAVLRCMEKPDVVAAKLAGDKTAGTLPAIPHCNKPETMPWFIEWPA